MKTRKLFEGAAFAVVVASVACSASSSTTAANTYPPSVAAEDGSALDASASSASGQEILPAHRSPAAGCASSEIACGPDGRESPLVCTNPKGDSFNCGACGEGCAIGESCIDGSCSPSGDCSGGVFCDGECVFGRYFNPSHCGSCSSRCGERELCHGYECHAAGGGSGMTCDAPLLVPAATASPSFGFHLSGALVGTHRFACGPLSPIPTRWFRFTADRTGPIDISAVAEPKADLVVEIFASPCSPDGGGASLACNDNDFDPTPRLRFSASEGQTYLVAVGVVSGSPSWARLEL